MEIEAEVTDGVVEAFGRAQDEARTLGHGYLGTEHLVIVFSEIESSRGASSLRTQGISPDALRSELQQLFEANNWNRYVPDEESLSTVGVDLAAIRAKTEAEFGEGALPMRRGSPGFTMRVKRIVEGASARTQQAHGRKADIDDVFAALLDDGDSVGVKILERAGADITALRAALG